MGRFRSDDFEALYYDGFQPFARNLGPTINVSELGMDDFQIVFSAICGEPNSQKRAEILGEPKIKNAIKNLMSKYIKWNVSKLVARQDVSNFRITKDVGFKGTPRIIKITEHPNKIIFKADDFDGNYLKFADEE